MPASTEAFKAGLRAGDVIEVIDGQPVYSAAGPMVLPKTVGARSTCIVVRDKEKITLTLPYSANPDPNTP